MNKTKTVFASTLLVGVLCSGAFANVRFGWESLGASDVRRTGGADLPSGSTVLLFGSVDTTVNFNTGVQLNSTYGDDQFIGSQSTLYSGLMDTAIAQNFGATGSGAGSWVGYHVYAVYVDFAYTAGLTPENIPVGTNYVVMTQMGFDDGNGTNVLIQHDPAGQPPPEQTFHYYGSTPLIANVQNVPEPTSIALLGLGLVLIGFRRFRK